MLLALLKRLDCQLERHVEEVFYVISGCEGRDDQFEKAWMQARRSIVGGWRRACDVIKIRQAAGAPALQIDERIVDIVKTPLCQTHVLEDMYLFVERKTHFLLQIQTQKGDDENTLTLTTFYITALKCITDSTQGEMGDGISGSFLELQNQFRTHFSEYFIRVEKGQSIYSAIEQAKALEWTQMKIEPRNVTIHLCGSDAEGKKIEYILNFTCRMFKNGIGNGKTD
jgi:hypothetical protein